MTTPLAHDLKRELRLGPDPYTLTISPGGLKLVPKGKRNGLELRWMDLISGQAALAVALNASLARIGQFTSSPVRRRGGQPKSAVPTAKERRHVRKRRTASR